MMMGRSVTIGPRGVEAVHGVVRGKGLIRPAGPTPSSGRHQSPNTEALSPVAGPWARCWGRKPTVRFRRRLREDRSRRRARRACGPTEAWLEGEHMRRQAIEDALEALNHARRERRRVRQMDLEEVR